MISRGVAADGLAATDSPATRLLLAGVVLPSRRARLGQDTTGSSDNLTLGPIIKRPKLEQAVPPVSYPKHDAGEKS